MKGSGDLYLTVDGMTKQRKYTPLTEEDKFALHAAIRRGEPGLAKRFGITGHTLHTQQQLVLMQMRRNKPLCRHGVCREEGTGTPPFCNEHRPEPPTPSVILPWTIPPERLRAGRA